MDTKPQPPEFALVGIGASAGGLEAITQLLRHLPAEPNLALFVVQHLDRHQASLLRELLSRDCLLTIVEAADGMQVLNNHVYVLPPNSMMTVEDGYLRLVERPATGVFMPIDILFRSLAQEVETRAIAVVLSGNGTDGAIGLEAIKQADGIAFVQDEQSAQNVSMPRSAVATGYVDFVLPPGEIAKELVRLAQRTVLVEPAGDIASQLNDQQVLGSIFRALRNASGIDFSQYKQTTIKRRIVRRMGLLGHDRLADYAAMVQDDPDELYALQQDFLIRVTSFFRDPASFTSLQETIFPALIRNRRPGLPIRVWVAGCSTGEEVYSLAIALIEALGDMVSNTPIKILATDVNEAAIEKARAGTYVDNIALDVSPERLRRFFSKVNGSYQISKAVRDLCVFSRHNVTRDTPFANLDLISCRNLMIYLDLAMQKRVLPYFHYGLRSNGFLMLGSSETIGAHTELFEVVDKENRIYQKRPLAMRMGIEFPVPEGPFFANRRDHDDVAAPSSQADEEHEIDRMLAYRFSPPVLVVDEHLTVIKMHSRRAISARHLNSDVSPELLRVTREQLILELREAIECVKRDKLPARREGLEVNDGERIRRIAFDVIPLEASARTSRTFAIVVEELRDATDTAWPEAVTEQADGKAAERVQKLERLLGSAREQLQSIVEENEATNEELKAANEEILSSNEELQSTNEELQTAKEEMQSTNEELATVNDELKHRNGELAQLNDDLLNLFGAINFPVIIVSRDLRIRRFTPPAGALFNLIAADVGRPITHLQPNIDLPSLAAMIGKVVDTFETMEVEVRDKEGRWLALRIRPYVTSDKRIDGAAISLVDIDAIKRQAEHLRASRDNAEAIVETVWEPLLVIDQDLTVRRANAAFYRTFGLDAESVEGEQMAKLPVIGMASPQLCDNLKRVLTDNTRIRDFEISLSWGEGNRDLLINAHRIFWEGSGTQMILAAIEDVTSRKREIEQAKQLAYEQAARAEAEQANRAKDEFLAMLAHELRNPLAPVRNTLAILRQRLHDDEVASHALTISERQIAHMARLLDDLLDISRITRGKIRLQKQLLNVQDSLQRMVEGVRELIHSRGHQFEVEIPQEPLYVEADPARFEQIFSNLLHNAAKYTDRGGFIRLFAVASNSHVSISVSDNGIGISPDLLPRIFDLFTQADHSLERSQSGLGIGLTLVRNLVALHGGRVEATSSGPGTGSTFTVTLPILSRHGSLAPAVPRIAAHSARHLRILVIDDNVAAAQTLALLIEQWGHKASIANSGAEGLEVASRERPEVILLDIGLPGISGYDVARAIRSNPVTSNIVLIATTGYGKEEDRQQSERVGIDHHLVKPVNPAELAQLLNDLPG